MSEQQTTPEQPADEQPAARVPASRRGSRGEQRPAAGPVVVTEGAAEGWAFTFRGGFRLPAFKSTPVWRAEYGVGPEGERGLWLWADAGAPEGRPVARIPLVVARVIQRDGEDRKCGFLYLTAADDSGTGERELMSRQGMERSSVGSVIGIMMPSTADLRGLVLSAVMILGDKCPVVIEQIPKVDPVTGRFPSLDPEILPTGYGLLAPGASADHLAAWRELAPVIAAHPKIALTLGMNAAAPFVSPLGRQSRILNLTGPGRQGKTTTLRLGASLWGMPGRPGLRRIVRSWNASAQGLPQFLGRLGVLPGYFDEQGSGDARAGEMMRSAYSMVEGNSRSTGTTDGLGRTTAGWAGMIMSTSNASMLSRVQTTGAGAGIPARLLEVDAPFTTTSEASDALDRLAQASYGHVGAAILARFGVDDALALIRWAQDLMPIPEDATVSRTIRQHWHDALAGAVMLDTVLDTGTLIQESAARAARELTAGLTEPLEDAQVFLANLRDRIASDPAAWPAVATYEAWTRPRADMLSSNAERAEAMLPQYGVRNVQGIRADDDSWVGVIPSAWRALMEELQTDSPTVCRWLFERGLLEVVASDRERGEWTCRLPRIKADGKVKRIIAYKIRLATDAEDSAEPGHVADATPAMLPAPVPPVVPADGCSPAVAEWATQALSLIPTMSADQLEAPALTTELAAGEAAGAIPGDLAGRIRAACAGRLLELTPTPAAPVPPVPAIPAQPAPVEARRRPAVPQQPREYTGTPAEARRARYVDDAQQRGSVKRPEQRATLERTLAIIDGIASMDADALTDDEIGRLGSQIRLLAALEGEGKLHGPFAPYLEKRGPWWQPTLPDAFEEARARNFAFHRDYTGPAIVLDRSGAWPSAASSVTVAHGGYRHTGAIDDLKPGVLAPGVYLVEGQPWHEKELPSPLPGVKPGQKAWVPAPRMQLLRDLAEAGRWADSTALDSYVGQPVRLSKWTAYFGELRRYAREVHGRGSLPDEVVKISFGQAMGLLSGSWADDEETGKSKRVWHCKARRRDWKNTIEDQSAVNLWRVADECARLAPDAGPISMRNVDELVIPAAALERVTSEQPGGVRPAVRIDESGVQYGTFKTKAIEEWPITSSGEE